METNRQYFNCFLLIVRNERLTWMINPPAAIHTRGVQERWIRSARAILTSLMKSHGHFINDDSLQSPRTDVEATTNSCPSTVEVVLWQVTNLWIWAIWLPWRLKKFSHHLLQLVASGFFKLFCFILWDWLVLYTVTVSVLCSIIIQDCLSSP